MAMGTSFEFRVVESIVEKVFNSKIPDLVEVMEKARARYLVRFDSIALRLEGEILTLAGQLKALCLRIARERNFSVVEDTFDDLWFKLNDVFRQFYNHCSDLAIHLSDVQCLTLTDDEDLSSSSEDGESSSSEEEEVEMWEE